MAERSCEQLCTVFSSTSLIRDTARRNVHERLCADAEWACKLNMHISDFLRGEKRWFNELLAVIDPANVLDSV